MGRLSKLALLGSVAAAAAIAWAGMPGAWRFEALGGFFGRVTPLHAAAAVLLGFLPPLFFVLRRGRPGLSARAGFKGWVKARERPRGVTLSQIWAAQQSLTGLLEAVREETRQLREEVEKIRSDLQSPKTHAPPAASEPKGEGGSQRRPAAAGDGAHKPAKGPAASEVGLASNLAGLLGEASRLRQRLKGGAGGGA